MWSEEESPWSKYRCLAIQKDSGLAAQILAKSFHLSQGVLVARTVSRRDATVQALESLFSAPRLGKSLGRHLIGRNIIRAVFNERGEFNESGINIALADVLHGEAIARKGVRRVKLQNFEE